MRKYKVVDEFQSLLFLWRFSSLVSLSLFWASTKGPLISSTRASTARANHVPKRMTLRQGNAGSVDAAIVKMDGVLAPAFRHLPDAERKRNELFSPEFVKHLLGFCS